MLEWWDCRGQEEPSKKLTAVFGHGYVQHYNLWFFWVGSFNEELLQLFLRYADLRKQKKRWDWTLRLDSFIIGGQISSEVSTYTGRLLLPQRTSITCNRWTLCENSYYKIRMYTQLKYISSSSQKGIGRKIPYLKVALARSENMSKFLGLENVLPRTLCKAIGRGCRCCSSTICRCQDFLTLPVWFSQQQHSDCVDPLLTIRPAAKELQSAVVVPEAVASASQTQAKTQGVLLFFLKVLNCLHCKLLPCPGESLRQGPAAVPTQG